METLEEREERKQMYIVQALRHNKDLISDLELIKAASELFEKENEL